MRSSHCSFSLSPLTAFVVVMAVLLMSAPPTSMAKRFDCQMFCRTTGFSGMVGGCRCSFTLFTAKRSTRDHNSVPEENLAYLQELESERKPDYTLEELLRMDRDTHEVQSAEDEAETQYEASKQKFPLAQGLPKNHPVRLLVKPRSVNQQQHRSSRLGRSPSQLITKRREFEQDLDNGDTSDFLRLPY
ncbi:uncharacterized protein [Palaemon carinicauda]|uniref:uncharacterized protein n=1 Tax=Palaemon carinicauda TaxID=392227 RepID=UPI0035B57981